MVILAKKDTIGKSAFSRSLTTGDERWFLARPWSHSIVFDWELRNIRTDWIRSQEEATLWHQILAGSNFCDLCIFFMICRKKFLQQKIPKKFHLQKFTPLSKLYPNIAFYTLLKPSLSITNKMKLETNIQQWNDKIIVGTLQVFSS